MTCCILPAVKPTTVLPDTRGVVLRHVGHLADSTVIYIFQISINISLYCTHVQLSFYLSFFAAGLVMRPYATGPMHNPYIQNLLEAFASLKRGLQYNKARFSYSR